MKTVIAVKEGKTYCIITEKPNYLQLFGKYQDFIILKGNWKKEISKIGVNKLYKIIKSIERGGLDGSV